MGSEQQIWRKVRGKVRYHHDAREEHSLLFLSVTPQKHDKFTAARNHWAESQGTAEGLYDSSGLSLPPSPKPQQQHPSHTLEQHPPLLYILDVHLVHPWQHTALVA